MSDIWPYESYAKIFAERARRFNSIQKNYIYQVGAEEYYKDKPVEFVNDWMITYNPRNSSKQLPTTMPFILFPKQIDLIDFLYECLLTGESGLIEKARDMGATWVCCGFSVWMFLYQPGSSIGWGSWKERLVDRIGDPDSIFEKIRKILDYLPKWFLPVGFKPDIHCSYMKIINPENGATITGEAGDNIGRGGRKSIYFKDESAHYERPEKIEAALGDNTDVQIDFSSVNGPGNIFYRRRMGGVIWEPGKEIPSGTVRVFILDWRDHPLKTDEWYERRRAKAEVEGLLHLFHQEVDRDYTSAVEGTLIPGAWVKAAIDAHIKLGFKAEGKEYAGLDPYDEGDDAHAFVARKGSVVTFIDKWHQGDTGQAARKAIHHCKQLGTKSLQFDSIGVGAGVKSETNRLYLDGKLPDHLHVQKWSASAGVKNPAGNIIEGDLESPKNRDFFENLKAQAGWELRLRFERTFKAVTKGEEFGPDTLISIPSKLEYRHELESELSQPTYKPSSSGKIVINKKPAGTKSPNLFDGIMMAFWPADPIFQGVIVGGPEGIANTNKIAMG